MKISEILHNAADNYLVELTRYELANNDFFKERYSCLAVYASIDAVYKSSLDRVEVSNIIMEGLREMGCPTNSTRAFGKEPPYNPDPEIQQNRYFWLKWAALMAEEQGE